MMKQWFSCHCHTKVPPLCGKQCNGLHGAYLRHLGLEAPKRLGDEVLDEALLPDVLHPRDPLVQRGLQGGDPLRTVPQRPSNGGGPYGGWPHMMDGLIWRMPHCHWPFPAFPRLGTARALLPQRLFGRNGCRSVGVGAGSGLMSQWRAPWK